MNPYTKFLTLIIIVLLSGACGRVMSSKHKNITLKTSVTMTYQEKLQQCKSGYPFAKWREMVNDGLDQYTEENCNKAKSIFDELIGNLIKEGENAQQKKKVALFEKAVLALNSLNEEEDGSLIETGEREELCELIDQITRASGLDPDDFGDGGGIADEWREW